MHRFGTLYAIRETLHDPDNLSRWAASPDRVTTESWFAVAAAVDNGRAPGPDEPLVAASIFSLAPELAPVTALPGKVTADWFATHVIASPPDRYYEPLLRRREFVGSRGVLRIYLSPRLSPLAPWLLDIGIDQVHTMTSEGPGYMPGMLWRYLPLSEPGWPWVVAIGIDENGIGQLLPRLLMPGPVGAASIATERWWMPFAGPAAFAPAWFGGDDLIPGALAGFAAEWQAPDQDTFRGRILRRVNGPESARYCDAAWLSMAFWNEDFLNSAARFYRLGSSYFAETCISPLALS